VFNFFNPPAIADEGRGGKVNPVSGAAEYRANRLRTARPYMTYTCRTLSIGRDEGWSGLREHRIL